MFKSLLQTNTVKICSYREDFKIPFALLIVVTTYMKNRNCLPEGHPVVNWWTNSNLNAMEHVIWAIDTVKANRKEKKREKEKW